MAIFPSIDATLGEAQVPRPTTISGSYQTPDRVLPIRRTSVKLSIPLDNEAAPANETLEPRNRPPISTGSRVPVRRDSLDRREAMLKGKEGSRQRRRWENDRLLSNPWAVAPLPSDWEIRPTYPTRSVPYYLAPLWDAAEFQRSVEAKLHGHARRGSRSHSRKPGPKLSSAEEAASNVPKEVRAKLKRARAAKGLLHDLEEEVRLFLQKWGEKQQLRDEEGLGDAPSTPPRRRRLDPHRSQATDSDDDDDFELVSPYRGTAGDALSSDGEDNEEIVFVGRAGLTTSDSPGRAAREANNLGLANDTAIAHDKMVFDGLAADKGAGFARWLVHSIGAYYGLRTWSVTKDGVPPRREAYVGLGLEGGWSTRACGFGPVGVMGGDIELPRPLWGMV